ncbi:CBS domain-containing protein [Rhizobium leguminosarum]|uniref:CBS domain-containing protein n=1 Tax=Rhizobium leguminosarum TaxID=384 RepID=UPI00396572F8
MQDAATIMAEIVAGAVPVGDNDRLVGIITDRDIAVRAVSRGKGPDAKIAEVMTAEVKYCFEDGTSIRCCRTSATSKSAISRPGGEHLQTGGARA